MIMMNMMMLDVLQESDVVNDDKDDRCFGSTNKTFCFAPRPNMKENSN